MAQNENEEIRIVITINREPEGTHKEMEIFGKITLIEAIGYLHMCIHELTLECEGSERVVDYKEPPLIALDIMQRRLKLDLSIAQVSKETGLSYRTVSHLEKGFKDEPNEFRILENYYKLKEQQKSKSNG